MKQKRIRFNNLGFTLLELLVVAAIIVVIAAFAIPGYTNYITQTRANALWAQAEAAKLAVESIYLKQNTAFGSITTNAGAAEYTTANVDFVKCITVQNGIISVVGDPTKFNNLSVWIAWEPTVTLGAVTWSCVYSTDAAQYVTDIANACSACVQISGSCVQPFATDSACI